MIAQADNTIDRIVHRSCFSRRKTLMSEENRMTPPLTSPNCTDAGNVVITVSDNNSAVQLAIPYPMIPGIPLRPVRGANPVLPPQIHIVAADNSDAAA